MVESNQVRSDRATELQAVVLRACLLDWKSATGLGDSPTAAARQRILVRLVKRGWLETRDRAPARVRGDRGRTRRWKLYRTTAAGRAAILDPCPP